MRAIVFPGQGSQHRGMGADVFQRYPEMVAEANAVLGFDIADTCLKNPNAILDRTDVTQPAIYVVSSLQFKQLVEGQQRPDFVAGHSLGEYSALAAAGVFSFSDGLRIVKRRGDLMAAASGGGLVAVVGLGRREVERLFDGIPGVEIANVNSPDQIVVGGRKDKLQRLLEVCAERSVRAIPLRVSGAFHTSEMKKAALEFGQVLKTVRFHPPEIPVLSNVDGNVHEADGIADLLVQQMISPVLWCDCVQTMLKAGVREFVEVGRTQVLMPLISKIRSHAESVSKAAIAAPRPTPAAQTASSPRKCTGDLFTQQFRCSRPIVVGTSGSGISGGRLVTSLVTNGVLAFFDAASFSLNALDDALGVLNANKDVRGRFGVSMQGGDAETGRERDLVELLIKHGVGCIETHGYEKPSSALVRYREYDEGNRVLAHVDTRNAAAAFLVGAFPTPDNEGFPDASGSPWAQAICVDFNAVHAHAGADFNLLLEVLAWRDARRLRSAGEPFSVGASGAASDRRSIASLLEIVDFAMIESFYLLTRESDLDDECKREIAATGRYQRLPNWQFPELNSRSWSIARSNAFCEVAERIYEIYVAGRADHAEWERLSSTLPDPFSTSLRELGEELSRAKDAQMFRARLRTTARKCLSPGILECDVPLPELQRQLHMATGSHGSLPSSDDVSELLYPLS